MSASPAGPPSGPSSTTPNGAAAAAPRRKRPQGSLFLAKKPAKKPALAPTNGISSSTRPKPAETAPVKTEEDDPDDDPSTYTSYPLVASTKADLEGLRFHAMRLVSDGAINPWDQTQFTHPLRLHRRFPRDKMNQPMAEEDGVDSKEREKEEIRRAERQAQREADQAQIAPTGKPEQNKKKQMFKGKGKVEDVYHPQDTDAARKKSRLRYEEGRPWHLEDFDSKNVWVGAYEEPLSESHVMLSLSADGKFRMVPLEKWYRFTATNRYKTLDLDAAEKVMAQKHRPGRWLAEKEQGMTVRKRLEAQRMTMHERGRVGMRSEQRPKGEDDDDGYKADAADDQDELDFEHEDEFQDDDEGKLFGEYDDEETKETERRVRQEMLGANIFAGTGVKEDKDWDKEDEEEKKKAAEERKRSKGTRKTLVKSERAYEYQSDSDHPYSEESESENSEEERQKEEERKKEEEKLKTDGANKAPSVASTAATNTPSGRTEKHGDPRAASLKRPGSPGLSEASGSESSRKRMKKDANGKSSRAMSPSARIRGAGSGSDTEASGTERSKPKIKVTANRPGSPIAGSPSASAPGSRPDSPPPAIAGMPSLEQVRAAIPNSGISIPDLIKIFRDQIPKSREAHAAFIDIVKRVGKNNPEDKKLIVPKLVEHFKTFEVTKTGEAKSAFIDIAKRVGQQNPNDKQIIVPNIFDLIMILAKPRSREEACAFYEKSAFMDIIKRIAMYKSPDKKIIVPK
ncbi:hypothetical protein MBLNU457_6146t1 [Dothideomycetes sp. NU457]